jgi:GNAT superfamily N-acetyltransferase
MAAEYFRDLRLPPEDLFIRVDENSLAELLSPTWQQKEWGREERALQLFPTLNGEPCGTLYARFIVKNYGDDKDKYVWLSNIEVRRTRTQGNTRRQGIGATLLTELERYAERFGASRIEGIISSVDLKETPMLPTFYQNRGYQLTPKEAGFTMVKLLC